jgi:molybdopterin-binding protein
MNTLRATITATTSSEHLTCLSVTVENDLFHLLLAESSHEAIGTQVILAFKETEVILLASETASTANIAQATVQNIRRGNVLTEVTLAYRDTIITALVPTLTYEKLDVSAGDTVSWMVQPSEISLLRGSHGI